MSMKHWGLAVLGLMSVPLAWAGDVCTIPGGCNTVPEPETLALLAVAGLAACVARRSRRK